MTDEQFTATQAGLALMEKARKAIARRSLTDRPGGDWHVNDGRPRYCGVHNVAVMYPTGDGQRFEVIVYTYAGREILRGDWKGLDAAFRNGRMYANSDYSNSRR